MIPRETVEQILAAAKIEQVVGDFVSLRRRGANFVACCPFHNEKTPSFYVSPAKGIYSCFGCHKSGNVIGFVMEHEKCSYVDALRYVGKKYGIEIKEREETPEEILQHQRRDSLFLVNEFARKFYNEALSEGEGRSIGYAYFKKRLLEDSTIDKFSLGWAPSGRTALLDAALKAGYKEENLLAAGLVVKREDGSLADKFRERVMFPIYSVSGRVVAFSGRTLRSDNPAKYVNTAETEIYVKSENLLGINFAKSEISRLQRCILVEGNVDMVMMHQKGICNVVASCGTALTVQQIRLIHKFTDNATIMYDGDGAGINAALRGVNMFLSEGIDVDIVVLPDGEDPDSFCRSHSLEEVLEYISGNSRDFISFKTQLLLSQAGSDPIKRAELINDIADSVSCISDPIKRSTCAQIVSRSFEVEDSLVFRRIAATRASRDSASISRAGADTFSAQTSGETVPTFENATLAPAEKDIVSFLLTHGRDILEFESDSEFYSEDERQSVADFIREALDADEAVLANAAYRKIYEEYFRLYDGGGEQEEIVQSLVNSPEPDFAARCIELSNSKYQLTVASFAGSLTTTSSWLVNYVPKVIMVYNEKRLTDRIERIRKSIKDAPPEELEKLLGEFSRYQDVRRRIRQKLGREKI